MVQYRSSPSNICQHAKVRLRATHRDWFDWAQEDHDASLVDAAEMGGEGYTKHDNLWKAEVVLDDRQMTLAVASMMAALMVADSALAAPAAMSALAVVNSAMAPAVNRAPATVNRAPATVDRASATVDSASVAANRASVPPVASAASRVMRDDRENALAVAGGGGEVVHARIDGDRGAEQNDEAADIGD